MVKEGMKPEETKVAETIWAVATKVVTRAETRAETHLVDEV